jgi:hypothetical protein
MCWICNTNVDTINACRILWGKPFDPCHLKERIGDETLILRWNLTKLSIRWMEMFLDHVQRQALIIGCFQETVC